MNPPRIPDSDPMLSPRNSAPRRSDSFVSRLGVYLIGVALGLMIVGLIWQNRQRERAQRQAERGDALPAWAAPIPPGAPPSAPR